MWSTPKPFQSGVTAPTSRASAAAAARIAAPSGRASAPGADDDQRALGRLQRLGEAVPAGGELGQGLGAGAEIVVGVGQVDRLADQADRQRRHAPALADAHVEEGGLEARVGADDQDRVRLLDAGDGRR